MDGGHYFDERGFHRLRTVNHGDLFLDRILVQRADREVWQGRTPRSQRTVAVKIDASGRKQTWSASGDLDFEAWLQANLTRTVAAYVVPVLYVDAVKEEPLENEVALPESTSGHVSPASSVMVMEFISGGTLRDLYSRGEPRSFLDALAIAIGIAQAVEALHDAGRAHLDIKPSNLGFTGAASRLSPIGFGAKTIPAVKLLDFGSATNNSRTPAYCSPEQADGSPAISPASDIYSFGGVLYELFAGRLAFTLPTSEAFLEAHRFLVPDPFEIRFPHDPWPIAAFRDLIGQMMSKEPDQRPLAREVSSHLENCLQGRAKRTIAVDTVWTRNLVADRRLAFSAWAEAWGS